MSIPILLVPPHPVMLVIRLMYTIDYSVAESRCAVPILNTCFSGACAQSYNVLVGERMNQPMHASVERLRLPVDERWQRVVPIVRVGGAIER